MTITTTRPTAQAQMSQIAQDNGWTVQTIVENEVDANGTQYDCIAYLHGGLGGAAVRTGVIIWVHEGRAASYLVMDGKEFKGALSLINFRKFLEAAA